MIQISAIVCTYNGEKHLFKTLQSLAEQSLEADSYEVVIVDNNSTDSVAAISQGFIKYNSHLNIQYCLETQAGLSFARNCGIEASKGDYVVFIDDDATANKDFLAQHLQIYKEKKDAVAAGGKVLGTYPTGMAPNWLSPYIEGVFSLIDRGEKVHLFEKKFPVGCNMSFKKSALQQMGSFNTNVKYRSDEKFVFLQLKKSKKAIYYLPQAIAYHNIDETRMSKASVIKVSQLVGAGERERLYPDWLALTIKLIEYLFKLGASWAIGLGYLLKGQASKAAYIVLVRWYVLQGFFFYRN
ncbi:MAG: glycosyltransferase [Chitinophagales bacterium]